MSAANSKTMKTVNMHEAKTHLSRLVAEAVQGKPFIIAKAGKALVRVESIEDPEEKRAVKTSWLGSMRGQFTVPDNFKDIGRDEIEEMFGLKD